MGSETPATTAATFCATFVDEWARAGVTAAFVAPGSRSTPLALALAADVRIDVHVFHDERAASFAGLGSAMSTGQPAIVVCSSGTAGTHFHAAVVEADHSGVPLIVCTADRPPELWDTGAPQTVDQTKLFGASVRWFLEPGVPDEDTASTWRSLASRTVAEALGIRSGPGPVHCNLSFRDPLTGSPGPLPVGRAGDAPWHHVDPGLRLSRQPDSGSLPDLTGRSGLIIAGAHTPDPDAVVALARRLGWPLLADHRSMCRGPSAINHFDSLLRSASFRAALTSEGFESEIGIGSPEFILRFGQPLTSKSLSQWLAASEAELVVSSSNRQWLDPERSAATVVAADGLASALLAVAAAHGPSNDAERWQAADAAATVAITETLDSSAPDAPDGRQTGWTEPGIVRAVISEVPAESTVLVASSMPIRDLEWFGPPRDDVEVVANRGANGIDGLVSTAIGLATSGAATTLLIGDVAFLHDSSALIALEGREIDLTIVVIDNDGGGIFGFLPQHELLPTERFEQLFGTAHGTDLEKLVAAHGLAASQWTGKPPTPRGIQVVIARTDRERNLDLHASLHAAVDTAVAAAL